MGSPPCQETETLVQLLAELYRQEQSLRPEDPYLQLHASDRFIRSQVKVFRWYQPWLPMEGRILDWGCRHAPDSCMIKAARPRVQLFGCDIPGAGPYKTFHHYADLQFTPLADVVRLPFDNEQFDAVIGSGTLEHVAQDYESLKQLYRVLKPNGLLVITYLPNRLSVDEWHRRHILKREAHPRLYGLGEIRHLLLHHGFAPLQVGYQTSLDLLESTSTRHHLLRPLCRLLPMHWFSSTLCLAARKVNCFI